MMLELAGTAGDVFSSVKQLLGIDGKTMVAVLQIVGINILLSGDNAVVIALACRSLPEDKRKWGIGLGVLAAILLRVVFTIALQSLLGWPWLTLVGGILLLLIAIQLVIEADHGDKQVADSKTLAGAVGTIAIADMVMSLDNVLAIAGAAQGKPWLIVFGLAMSVPLIVGGATLILGLLTRFPALVWAGAALLGWIGGELIAKDPAALAATESLASTFGLSPAQAVPAAGALGIALVLAIGFIIVTARRKRTPTAS